MLGYIFAILVSFAFTFIITVPFINLLYKFNIRRVSKLDLDILLPGREVKMGTPIMGGFVIIAAIIVLSFVFMPNWEYTMAVVFVSAFGAIFGFIDEYVNTLGRTIEAVRISRSKNNGVSLFPVKGVLLEIKKVLLVPWQVFEEALRVMGGEQKGLKNHYKFMMYVFLSFIPVFYLYINGHAASVYLPLIGGSIGLGWFYYLFVMFLMFGFAAAFGITDGMDGLSAGTHSIAFLCYGILAAYFGYTNVAYLAFIILGAELAFLYFNINPARVEMSDVGTLPLGMLFVFIAVIMGLEMTLPIIGMIFVVEILSSVSQQWSVKLRGKRIFLVAPIHHHFEKMGWSETKVTMRFWLFGIIFGLFGMAIGLF